MVSIRTVIKDFGRPVCRRCINQKYNVNLQPQDCEYDGPYAAICSNCDEVHHIVIGFSLSGKFKMLTK